MRSRLIVCEGPTHVLHATAAVRQWASAPEEHVYVILGLCCSNPTAASIAATCTALIKSLNPQARVLNYSELDHYLSLAQQQVVAFDYASQLRSDLFRDLQEREITHVFLTRNWQPHCEVILSLFSDAERVCVGDINSFDSALDERTGQPIGFTGSCCLYPYASEDTLPTAFQRIGLKEYREIFATCLNIVNFEPTFKQELEAIDAFNPDWIIPTANLTECGDFTSLKEEIAYYAEEISANIAPQARLLIKGHPRETLRQSLILAKELRRHSYQTLVVTDLKLFPIEFLCMRWKRAGLFSVWSSSGGLIQVLSENKVLLFSSKPKIIEKYYSSEKVAVILRWMQFLDQWVQNVLNQ